MTAELNFTTTAVPEQATRGRNREPNPFEGKFPTKVDENGKPVEALEITLPANTDEETKFIAKVKAQAQDQAKRTVDETHPDGYTARVKWEANEEKRGKTVHKTVTLKIWTVDRIFRPRTEKPAQS